MWLLQARWYLRDCLLGMVSFVWVSDQPVDSSKTSIACFGRLSWFHPLFFGFQGCEEHRHPVFLQGRISAFALQILIVRFQLDSSTKKLQGRGQEK